MHVGKLIHLLNFNGCMCQYSYHTHGYLVDITENLTIFFLNPCYPVGSSDTNHIFYFLVPEPSSYV